MRFTNGINMFNAILDDLSLLRDSMAAIAELIDETELIIRQDGIKMLASDRAVVVVVDFFLSKDAFKEYNYQNDMRIGVNLINLLRILKRAATDDIMHLKIDKNIEIKFIGSSSRTFTLPTIDVSKEEMPPIDKLEFTSTFDMKSDVLSNGIDDADLVSDSVIFTAMNDKAFMRTEGDQSSAELELLPNINLKNLVIGDGARARYSLDYLKKIIKAKKLAEMVSIAFSTDYPMRISYNVPNRTKLSFILAPRVEE